MAVFDRDYMRSRPPAPLSLPRSSCVRILVLLAVAFVVQHGARGWFGTDVAPPLLLSRPAILAGRAWTILTYALLHADAMHLVFNGIGLWFFGRLVEGAVGGARYAAFFAIGAAVATIPFLAVEFARGGGTQTLGASGVVLAAIVFSAFRWPGLPVVLFVFPMKLWHLAVLYVVLDVAGAASGTGDTNHLVHLGGAAYGFAAHRFGVWPQWRRRPRPSPPSAAAATDGDPRAEVDRLLDKITREGIGSLTTKERAFLQESSKRYR